MLKLRYFGVGLAPVTWLGSIFIDSGYPLVAMLFACFCCLFDIANAERKE